MRGRRGVLLAAGVVLLVALSGLPARAAAEDPGADRPNIVLIVTDDQRWDTLWAMPAVQRDLVGPGVTFAQGFVTNPLCCPSRTSILTGDYSHTTLVYRQIPPFGRFEWFDDRSTVATWLRDAGYTTAFVGKYVDGYQHAALTGYVPPGWDRWVAFVHEGYRDYKLTVDGTVRTYGNGPGDYSTRVLGDEAARFVSSASTPFFLEFAPAAPHAPAIPEPRYAGSFADLPPWRPPSLGEADVSDKPAYVRDLPALTAADVAGLEAFRRDQYRSLLSVDDQVARLIDLLSASGALAHTLIIFTSDNGLSWGEHRWLRKEVPYEESVRVPFVVRFDDAVAEPRVDDHLALNIDIAPTIADAAGVDAPRTDGRSLLPLLSDPGTAWRGRFLVEHMEGFNAVPTYCAVRTVDAMYVRYATGETELYDLARDPYEQVNLVGRPAASSMLPRMQQDLRELCSPEPPGLAGSSAGRLAVGLGLLVLLLAAAAFDGRRLRRASSSAMT